MDETREFFEAIKAGNAERVEQMLAGNPSLANQRDEAGISAVLTAIYYSQRPTADRLIEAGAHLDAFEAAAAGDVERVTELVRADTALVNAFAPDGFQLLGLAAFFGHVSVVDWLLGQGAEVNSASRNGMRVTALHSAVAGGHLPIAQALLEHGADPNARQAGEFAPLHGAAQNGQLEMVELLLRYGADPDSRNAEGMRPVAIAREWKHEEVVTLLQKRRAAGTGAA